MTHLTPEEQMIENAFETLESVTNKEKEMSLLKRMAADSQKKKSITLRVSLHDMEAIKIKASKCGLPYQTYINMLIHRDANSLTLL